MDQKKIHDIKLIVNNEKDLYNPFSPDNEFHKNIRDYIKSKYSSAGFDDSLRLTVISSAPLDEEKFRSAVANWILDEKEIFRQESKISNRMLIGMLAIASFFIILSLFLQKHVDVLSYTIIPVLGSVSLGRAAGICITDLPMNNAKKILLNKMEKNSIIIFEQAEAA